MFQTHDPRHWTRSTLPRKITKPNYEPIKCLKINLKKEYQPQSHKRFSNKKITIKRMRIKIEIKINFIFD